MLKRRGIGYALIGLLLLAALLLSRPILLSGMDFKLPFDRVWYYRMALGRGEVVEPFMWRLGLPWMAKILPFGIENNFRILCFVSLSATAIALYELARHKLKNIALSLLAVFFLFANFLIGRGMDDFWLTDMPTFAFVALIGLCYAKEWWIPLVILSFLGGAVREMIPLLAGAFCFAIRPSWHAGLPVAGLASYVCIRILIPDSYRPDFADVLAHRRANFSLKVFAFEYLMRPLSAGVAILAAWMVLRQRTVKTQWWRLVPTLLLVMLQLVSGTDNARLIVGIFVPLLWLAMLALDGVEISPRNQWLLFGLAAFGAVCSLARVSPPIYIGGHLGWVAVFLLANITPPKVSEPAKI
jgi:hypothetical protein